MPFHEEGAAGPAHVDGPAQCGPMAHGTRRYAHFIKLC